MPFIEGTKDLFKFIGENIHSRNIHDDTCERDKKATDKAKRLGCQCVDRFRLDLPDRFQRAIKADDLLDTMADIEHQGQAVTDDPEKAKTDTDE